MQKQRTKKQHYVPQSYLGRFLNANGKLFVFDKFKLQSRPSTTVNVAHENGFYELPPEISSQATRNGEPDGQLIEDALCSMENSFKHDINQLVRNVAEGKGIGKTMRVEMALYLTLQLVRTREFRETIQETTEAVASLLAREFAKQYVDDDEIERCRVTYPELNYKLQQCRAMFDEDAIVNFAQHLTPHIWFIGVNKTIQPLYTSDHPVVRQANVFKEGRNFSGLRSRGIEIAFPLDSKRVLMLLERTYFRELVGLEGTFVDMNAIEVDRVNKMQVMNCFRQVYCEKPEFDQAIGVCKRHPEICSPERKRADVTSKGHLITLLNR